MSSWTATIGIWRTNLFKLNDDGTLLETKRLDGVEYASKMIAPSGGGTTVLIGKNGGDPIDGSFANWGDPILIRFNPTFDVDWAYAYGGDEVHYTDDMIYTSDGRYFISARSSTDAYMIKTESNGTSVCETKAVTVELEDISFEEESPEVSSLDITYTKGEAPVFTISDIPFYNSEDKCCPYGLPAIGFEYSLGTENGELILNNTSTNADTYDWDFGDGNFSATTNASNQYETPGLYEVCLIASNDCGSEEFCEEILIEWSDVSISEWEIEAIRIYTTTKSVRIETNDLYGVHVHTNELSNVSVRLRNVLGQVLYEQDKLGANTSLLLPQQKTGLFFCDVLYRGQVLKVEKLFVD